MSKIVLDEVTSTTQVSKINENFTKLETALNDKVLYRDNPSGEPNTLVTDVDVNGVKLYNLPAPTLNSQAARLQDVQNALAGGDANLITFTQEGVGALTRNLQAKGSEDISATDFGSIQQAINAAGASGSVTIPANCTWTDAYTNENNIPILDLRHKQLGVWSNIGNAYPVNGYPQGNDMRIRARGPSDLYLEHYNVYCTTSASLVVGLNTNVLVSGVLVGNLSNPSEQSGGTELFSPIAQLVLGGETANEEQVNQGNWSVVDATHINITCTKTHSGTTDIIQGGSTLLASHDLYISSNAVQPGQLAGHNAPLKVKDLGGRLICKIPSNIDNAHPYRAWQWGTFQTGMIGANSDLMYQSATAASTTIWVSFAGVTVASLTDSGDFFVNKGITAIGEYNATDLFSGGLKLGKISSAITSTTEAFIGWAGNAQPLNLSGTAGSLLLVGRNTTNAEVVIAAEDTTNIRVAKNKLGFLGSTPIAKPAITGSRGGNAALASLLTQLALLGLITDSTSA